MLANFATPMAVATDQAILELRIAPGGETASTEVTFSNPNAVPARVTYAEEFNCCECRPVSVVIGPFQSRRVRVGVRRDSEGFPQTLSFNYYTSCGSRQIAGRREARM